MNCRGERSGNRQLILLSGEMLVLYGNRELPQLVEIIKAVNKTLYTIYKTIT